MEKPQFGIRDLLIQTVLVAVFLVVAMSLGSPSSAGIPMAVVAFTKLVTLGGLCGAVIGGFVRQYGFGALIGASSVAAVIFTIMATS